MYKLRIYDIINNDDFIKRWNMAKQINKPNKKVKKLSKKAKSSSKRINKTSKSHDRYLIDIISKRYLKDIKKDIC